MSACVRIYNLLLSTLILNMQFDIRRLDIYRKVPKDLTQPTLTGALISICSCVFMVYLFISELTFFITPEIVSQLIVDDPVSHNERIPVSLDVTLHKMACKYVGLDLQDDLGRHEVGMVENINRVPIDAGKGCRFKAHFTINKVPGNFHISTHSSSTQPDDPDMSHTVNEVIFGDRKPIHRNVPGSFNPLKGLRKSDSKVSHDYFMKVVPTVYESKSGADVYPFQYTFAYRHFTQYSANRKTVPAIWFRYDVSPITVKYIETTRPLYSFLTTVCAIVGGTFTVAGIIDSALFTASEVFRKIQLGKIS